MKGFLDKVIIQLRHNREAKGLSQQQLADLLEIGLRSYQRYENGESTPPIDLLYQASKVLNFDIKDLFDSTKLQSGNAHFKMYTEDDAEIFRRLPLVKESNLFDLCQRPSYRKVKQTNKVEEMLRDEEFMDSPYPLVISTPKFTVINHTLKSFIYHSSHVFASHLPHQDKVLLGKMWATLIDVNPIAFCHTMILPESNHSKVVNGKYLFENDNFRYFVTGVIEVK